MLGQVGEPRRGVPPRIQGHDDHAGNPGLRELAGRLEALSPMAILARGYSITRTIPHAEIVLDPEAVSINQDLEVIVSKGTLTCRVKDKSKNGPKNI